MFIPMWAIVASSYASASLAVAEADQARLRRMTSMAPQTMKTTSILAGMRLGERASLFGSAPLCNLKPRRGLTGFGFVFPLCARCSAIVVGALAGMVWVPCAVQPSLAFVFGTVPMGIDVFLQRYGAIESTNIRRVLTGLMFGVLLHQWTV